MRASWAVEKVPLNRQLASVTLLLAMVLLASTLLSSPSRAKLSYHKATPSGRQLDKPLDVSEEKFLEVPHIVWGLNNQKIAIARAALTARYLNRTLIAPTLTSSIFINSSDAMAFTDLFSIPSFNHRCQGFVKIINTPSVSARESSLDVKLGSGRKWTTEHDKQHLRALIRDGYEGVAIIKLVGRNPFLWPDHWPVQDYARVLECLILTDSLQSKVDRVVTKLRRASSQIAQPSKGNGTANRSAKDLKPRYVAVHMRVERDWRLHCRHLEDRALRMTKTRPHICATKEEIAKRVSRIPQLPKPALIYLAMADAFLEDTNLLQGWGEEMVPFEKKKLRVMELDYQKLPYIMQSAIDFEICKLADVFAGNSFSTFSSLVVMARTMAMKRRGLLDPCGTPMPSFAYNIGGPRPWVTNMSEPTLKSISYGSDEVGCQPLVKMQGSATLGS